VVRTGAGWFDNIDHMNTWTILNLNPPLSGSERYTGVTDPGQQLTVVGPLDGVTYTRTLRMYREGHPILTLNDPYLTQTGGVAVSRPVNTLMVPPDSRTGNVWKWSLDIQRELPGETSLTVGYVGSHGLNTGNAFANFNTAQPSPDSFVQDRRPFPRFYDPAKPSKGVQDLATIRLLDSFGSSFHSGLQVKVDKRYSNGLAYGLAYTYSKSYGDGENGGQEGVSYQNPYLNRSTESRGRFRFDQKHNMVGHWVWEMPGQNISGPVRYVIGGWQSNGIVALRSGFPFNVTQGGELNTGGPVRPDRIADGRLSDGNRRYWFDTQAFMRVTCNVPDRQDRCHYGNSGYNILDSPGQFNLDFGFFKNFQVSETMKFQLRWELFNATNTPYFRNPSGISFSTADTFIPDGPNNGEIRGIRTPMRIMQIALKFFF
jgi:hypothetical protein